MTLLDDIRPARGSSCVVPPEAVADLVPRIPADAHKYSRGVCELYVGSKDYPGAAVLSSCAANKLACGYVI
ncbi:MAG: NAD(P)H-hydrate dehydratase, partial [Slackia sp.]|nr:NAD(P)H-hydrate dehydratase [Slackia sp.]